MTSTPTSTPKVAGRWLAGLGLACGVLLVAASCNVVSGLDDLAFECGTALVPESGSCPEECNTGCTENETLCGLTCGVANPAYAPAMPWCDGQDIVCPPGKDCRVTCRTPTDCTDATIHCPEDYRCMVTCSGRNACLGAVVLCSDSGPCELLCEPGLAPDDGVACGSTNLVCGLNECAAVCLVNAGMASVTCGDACACSPCT